MEREVYVNTCSLYIRNRKAENKNNPRQFRGGC
jgi:hypothetical protein